MEMSATLRDRVKELCALTGAVDESPFCDDSCDGKGFSALESLVHELGHAVLLDLRLNTGELSVEVGRHCNMMTKDGGAHGEAQTWVIEWLVLRDLGFESKMPWDTCVEEGLIQEGVTEEEMERVKYEEIEEMGEHASFILRLLNCDKLDDLMSSIYPTD